MGMSMHRRWTIYLCVLLLSTTAFTQPNAHPNSTGRIVLFLPLHLDSIFDTQSNYRFKKNEFPRFVSGPLEFYQGFTEALDSLKVRPGYIDVHVIDIRSYESTRLQDLLDNDPIRAAGVWLLYGNATESRILAEAANKQKVPLINVNLPNDAGIDENPFYFLCNPTLQAQCESIYRHLQQHYPLHRIVVVRKKGGLDERIRSIWEEYGRSTRGVPLKYQSVEITDSITPELLAGKLDSTKEYILFGASLDERFARNLADAATELRASGYKFELMGMSTWENVREFSTTRYRNVEIIIPTPFYYSRNDTWIKRLQTRYQENFFGKLSDFYLRGYELAWLLHPTLQKDGDNLSEKLPGKKKLAFSDIDWQPVLNKESFRLEYFENKKLHFVKRMDGTIRSVR